jgi:amino-acid N-acetyltransferase
MSDAAIHIRSATESDARTIKRMVRAAQLDPTLLKWQNFLIAEYDGAVVGIGQVKPYRGGKELGSLVVASRWRHQGIGGAIVRALIDRERSKLFLLCAERLESFYAQFGFRRVGARELSGVVKWKYLLGRLFVRVFFGGRMIAMRREA